MKSTMICIPAGRKRKIADSEIYRLSFIYFHAYHVPMYIYIQPKACSNTNYGNELYSKLGLILWPCLLPHLLGRLFSHLVKDIMSPSRGKVVPFMPFQRVQLRKRILWQLPDLEIARNARGRNTLGQHNGPSLDAPATQHNTGVHAQSLSHLMHEGVVHSARLTGLVVAQGRVGLDEDIFALAVLQQIRLGEVRMGLDLVDSRDDLGLLEEMLQTTDAKVGDTDGPDLACLQQLLHGFVGGHVVDISQLEDPVVVDRKPLRTCYKGAVFVSLETFQEEYNRDNLHRPMHQIQIQIGHAQITQCLIHRRLDVLRRMLGIPQLAGEEDLLAWDPGIANSLTNFRLIAIDGGAVDVPISLAQGDFHGAFDFVGSCLPGAEAHGGDWGAGVESEMGGKRHDFVWFLLLSLN